MGKDKLETKKFPEYNQKVVKELVPELFDCLNNGMSGFELFKTACLYAFANNLQGEKIEEMKKDLRDYIKFFNLLQKTKDNAIVTKHANFN